MTEAEVSVAIQEAISAPSNSNPSSLREELLEEASYGTTREE